MLVYRIFYGPLLGIARIISFFNPKLRQGFKLRSGRKKPWLQFEASSQPLWFHCASGEFEYAKPVLREIKAQWPQQKILVTFFSPSVVNSLKSNPDVDFFCPLPWDKKSEFDQFIEHHNPKALLIARTDLWPNMIAACKSKKLPTLLFSKTVNTTKTGLSRWLERKLLKKLTAIFCVSNEDRSLLIKDLKNYKEVHAAGDTRYDQCLYRLQHGKTLKPLYNFYRPLFIAGSTWDKDEELLIPVIEELHNDMSFIIAPHEPTEKHLNKLTKQLDKLSLKYNFYSKTQSWDPEAILIVDQVGILADLYAWGQFSFVGGSMEKSVHSVMEPLAQGCLTFVGPFHKNNREAIHFQTVEVDGEAPVQVVTKSTELSDKLSSLSGRWGSLQKNNLQREVQKKAGASKIVVKWISNNTDINGPRL
ncbi:MAG: hypothetical protein HRT44_07895 [Bdellovibrionales bacterium]|nr:hypothetical protein [Bdellovibrionales bacterium]NQZ19161.1 hypothetical protein [Bdellovibrionales bacterium]